MDLDPARSGGDILSMVFGAPPFDETHAYSAMFGELVHSLVPMVHALREELCKLLIVEDFQRALRRNLTYSGRVEAVVKVTVPRLDEHGRVAEALGKHFATDVVEVDTLADVATRVLYGRVSVHVGHPTQAEAVRRGVGVGEAVYDEACAGRLEGLTDTDVELVVGDGAPVLWFVVCNRSHI